MPCLDDTLLHCIRLAQSTKIICTPDLAGFALTATRSLTESLQCLSLNLGSFTSKFTEESSVMGIRELAPFGVPETAHLDSEGEIYQAARGVADVAAVIYTSGTTGKPKACSIKNMQVCLTSCPTSADMSNPKRYFPLRTYACMPLFHGTTFFTGLCYSVGTSGAFCVARKFSASRFWRDVTESRATRMLYVGELCRYLCASPPTPFDRAHRCIVATGNGLQKDVWTAFKKRFGAPEIREYYRSTEGVAKYDNRNRGSSGVGKIGYSGLIRRTLEDDVFIVKFDYENERPLRDAKTGFCVLAALGEPGEAIGRIRSLATYTDYLNNREATEAKILRNVFQKGDIFQRSGDLLVQDRLGWVRFHDRIGETYRWKGENVSAGEVSGYICELDHVHDTILVGKKLTG
jgi:acyl-CoA synthetase (AMP-forming)/AMP-acid ligase II